MSFADTKAPSVSIATAAPRLSILRLVGARFRSAILAAILPVALVASWQFAGTEGALFGGALPTPDRVWTAWYAWAFGTPTFGLNPYVGTWAQNVLFSAERVFKGFLLAIVVGVPLGIAIGWWPARS